MKAWPLPRCIAMDPKTALTQFVAQAQAIVDAHMEKRFACNGKKVLTVEPGRKYARIVTQTEGDDYSRSVYCFVDMTNGNILKSESWKKPAKHARGNIFDADPIRAVGPYGANYLR